MSVRASVSLLRGMHWDVSFSRNHRTHYLTSFRPALQSSHNEEIVSHLYHAGFQTGVSSLSNDYSVFTKAFLLELRRHDPCTSFFFFQWFSTWAPDFMDLACPSKCISPTCNHIISFTISCTPHVHFSANDGTTYHIRSPWSRAWSNTGGTLFKSSSIFSGIISSGFF